MGVEGRVWGVEGGVWAEVLGVEGGVWGEKESLKKTGMASGNREGVRRELRSSLRMRQGTLLKKKIKFSSCIGKFRVEQMQSHI